MYFRTETPITIHDLMFIADAEGEPRYWGMQYPSVIRLGLNQTWYPEENEIYFCQYDDGKNLQKVFIRWDQVPEIITEEKVYEMRR